MAGFALQFGSVAWFREPGIAPVVAINPEGSGHAAVYNLRKAGRWLATAAACSGVSTSRTQGSEMVLRAIR